MKSTFTINLAPKENTKDCSSKYMFQLSISEEWACHYTLFQTHCLALQAKNSVRSASATVLAIQPKNLILKP